MFLSRNNLRFPGLLGLGALALLAAAATWILPAGAQETSLTLDFSSTSFLDPGSTTADWDTVSGTLHLPAFTAHELGSVSGANLGRVALAGDDVYMSSGTLGLSVVDVSNPAAPSLIYAEGGGHLVNDVDVYGDLLFAAGRTEGLHLYDVTNPAAPTYLGANSSYNDMRGVAARGALLYLADGVNGVHILNLAGTLFEIGTLDTPGVARDVDAAGNVAVVADDTYLRVIDVTDPSSPVEISSFAATEASSVQLDYPLVYLGTLTGMVILDISDPANPVQVGSFPAPDLVSISVDRDYAAVTTLGELYLVDVRDPALPAQQWMQPSGDESGAAVIKAGRIYWADGDTFRLVESALPLSMQYTRSPGITRNCFGAAVEGNVLYLYQDRDGFESVVTYDVTDAMNPVESGYLHLDLGLGSYGSDLAVSGGFVYLADRDGIKVIDARDPTAPVLVNTVLGTEDFYRIQTQGSYLVGATSTDIHVLALYDPANPSYGYTTGFGAHSIRLQGSYLYYTSGTTFGVYDLITTSPVGSLSLPSSADILAVDGNQVYVTSGSSIYAISVASPASPVLLNAGTPPIYVPRTGVVVGDRLAVLDDWHVALFDISDPTLLTEVDRIDLPSFSPYVPLGKTLVRVGDFLHAGRSHTAPGGSHTEDLYDILPVMSHRVDYTRNEARTVSLAAGHEGAAAWRILPAARTDSVSMYLGDVSGDTGIWPLSAVGSVAGMTLYPASSLVDPVVDEVTFEWAYEEPAITSIADTPNDQGKQVRLSWMKSANDLYSAPDPVTEYSVFRRIEVGYAPGMLSTASPPGTWDFVASVPADGLGTDGHYSVIVPTLADSTQSAGMHWTTYFVRGRTATRGTVYESPPTAATRSTTWPPRCRQGSWPPPPGAGSICPGIPTPSRMCGTTTSTGAHPRGSWPTISQGSGPPRATASATRLPAGRRTTRWRRSTSAETRASPRPPTAPSGWAVRRSPAASTSIRRAPTRSGRIRGSTTRFPRAGATSPWPYTTSRGAGCAPFRTAGARKGSPNSTGTAGTTAAARCPPGSTS